jgi:hypothetical protein
MALLPLQKKWCSRFLLPLKIHRPRSGSNPRTLGPVVNTLTTSPPTATLHTFTIIIILRHDQGLHFVYKGQDVDTVMRHNLYPTSKSKYQKWHSQPWINVLIQRCIAAAALTDKREIMNIVWKAISDVVHNSYVNKMATEVPSDSHWNGRT